MAKRDLSAAVKKGASQQPPAPVEDRFAKAAETLSRRPTGYAAPVAAATQTPSIPARQNLDPVWENGDSVPAEAHQSKLETDLSVTHLVGVAARLGIPVYEEVPIDLIDDNPYNARHIYLQERIDELAISLHKEGQLVPGIACRNGNRRTLIAAHYRKRAALQLGYKTLKLMVYPEVSSQDLYVLSFKENEQHQPQSVIDNAIAWQKLEEDKVYKSKEAIAEAIGVKASVVTKTLSYFELDASVRDILELDPSKYGMTLIYELSLLQKVGAPLSEVMDYARKVPLEEISRRQIEDIRKGYQNRTTRRPKQNSRQYRISADMHSGVIKEWDSGKVVLEILCSSVPEREAIVRELRSKFGAHVNLDGSAALEAGSEPSSS